MANLITSYNEGNDTVRLAGEDLTAGTMGAVKASDGEIYEAVDSAGYVMVGVIMDTVSEGDKVTLARPSYALVKNSTTNAVAYGNIGGLCYVEDEYTVGTASVAGLSSPSIAGRVVDVTSNGVIVDFTQKTADTASAT